MPKFILIIIVLTCTYKTLVAQPTGFIDEAISTNWTTPTGLTFDSDGTMIVWEKEGKVYTVNQGVKSEKPFIDISKEVLNYNDHGLIGFALDPNFKTNGFVYLLYVANYHYVTTFGTPAYNPDLNDGFKKSIGRVTRYSIRKEGNEFITDYTTRKVLIGEDIRNGIPILVDNHGVNSLVFGTDGSLLISVGDVAFIVEKNEDETLNPWFIEAVDQGIVKKEELVHAFRSQYKNSLNGKILRIDPSNGNGLPSNPFYDPNNPRKPASRVWAYGLRNPYRLTTFPNTGSTNIEEGNPGILVVGDVGWYRREEINLVKEGGQNFGWPSFEGITVQDKNFQNEKFPIENYQKPLIEWRGPVAQSIINEEPYVIGSPEFKGNAFTGSASIGGVFYDGNAFPSQYKGLYFQGDYLSWVKAFKFNDKKEIIEVIDFTENVHPTCFAANPIDGAIYYINYFYPDIHEIRKIYYNPNANLRPKPTVLSNVYYGQSPLTVNFKGSDSIDPEGKPLKFEWDFGNGNGSNEANPTFTYIGKTALPENYNVTLTVTDEQGLKASKSIQIYLNNTPPTILNTTIDNISTYTNVALFTTELDATVIDNEDTELEYQWQISLFHETHSHFIGAINTKKATLELPAIPCDSQQYHYEVKLKATDKSGLSSTFTKKITPLCSNSEVILSSENSITDAFIYPNPTSSIIKFKGLEGYSNQKFNIRLVNIFGEIIFEKSNFLSELEIELSENLQQLSSAMYLLNLENNNLRKTIKIIKK